jgi:hypothetical protein
MNEPKKWDRMEDIVDASRGIYETSALAEHEQVATGIGPEGVKISFRCQGCGDLIDLVLEWPEVISLKYGVDPAIAWRGKQQIVQEPMPFTFSHKEGAWAPMGKCGTPNCLWTYGIRIQTHEPERWLGQARRSGYIHPQREAQYSQYCDQLARQIRGQMQQQG